MRGPCHSPLHHANIRIHAAKENSAVNSHPHHKLKTDTVCIIQLRMKELAHEFKATTPIEVLGHGLDHLFPRYMSSVLYSDDSFASAVFPTLTMGL